MIESNIERNKMILRGAVPCATDKYFSRPIAIWGAGDSASLYQAGIARHSGRNASAGGGATPDLYIDKKTPMGGGASFGKKAIHPSVMDMEQMKNYAVLSCSSRMATNKAMLEEISRLGLDGMSLDKYIFAKNLDSVIEVMSTLEDDQSRDIYTDLIVSRLSNARPNDDYVCRTGKQYFCLPEFQVRSNSTTLVDLGAFVGDTVEDFAFIMCGTFGKVYAFEPAKDSFEALCKRVKRLNDEWAFPPDKIVTVNAGAGKKAHSAHVAIANDGSGLGNRIEEGAGDVSIVSVDDYFRNKRVTHIKADIESAEYEMLEGAVEVLKRDKPLLSICIYHSAFDMFDIPLLIKRMDLGYRMKFRRHAADYCEGVLYCY